MDCSICFAIMPFISKFCFLNFYNKLLGYSTCENVAQQFLVALAFLMLLYILWKSEIDYESELSVWVTANPGGVPYQYDNKPLLVANSFFFFFFFSGKYHKNKSYNVDYGDWF